jgi:flagellar protein FlgJ
MDISRIGSRELPEIVNKNISGYVQTDFEEIFQDAIERNDDKALKKSCQEMEKIFLSMIYKQMKATIPKSSLISKDCGREITDSLFDDVLIEEASKRNSFGLADMLYKQLKGF